MIALIAWIIFGQRQPSQNQLEFTPVKRQDLKVSVSTSGVFSGQDSVELHFKTAGKLAFINVKEGDQVFAGQTLAGLDTQDLSIAFQQAQNNLRDRQASVDKVLDDIHLFQYGNQTSGETMTQRQLRTTAEVARDNAFDSVKAAQRDFEDSFIVSPISGVVTKANLLPGQNVSGTDTLEVVDFSQSLFEADVDESDITKISAGQKAEVTLNAYGDKVFPGTVLEIIPQTKTTANGATVVTVKIVLNDQSIQKITGLNGQVSIITEEKNNVLTIPLEALRENQTVFIQTPQGIRLVKVTPGLASDTDVEIAEGLTDNDKVVKNPPGGLGGQFRTQNPLNRILRVFRLGR